MLAILNESVFIFYGWFTHLHTTHITTNRVDVTIFGVRPAGVLGAPREREKRVKVAIYK